MAVQLYGITIKQLYTPGPSLSTSHPNKCPSLPAEAAAVRSPLPAEQGTLLPGQVGRGATLSPLCLRRQGVCNTSLKDT